MTRRELAWKLAPYLGLAIIAALVSPLIGSESISLNKAFSGAGGIDAEIFFFQRTPRVLLALLVGGTLAMVGACFQGMFRNPLAEPYTLGVTGGSAVGAVMAIVFPGLHFGWWAFSSVQLFSLAGAFCSMAFIFALANRSGGIAMNTLLLAGVTVSILCGGLILFLRYIASPNYLVQMDRWLMGGLEVVGYRDLSALLPLLLPGLGLLFTTMVEINHLTLGRELAMGHGVDVHSTQIRVFVGGGVATAAVVSLAGPIGFVGLIAPHAVRRISGFDHRIVMPGSFLLGGAFLTLCDALARTAMAPREIPVGVITALIGGPVFISILLKRS
ncbi:MAG: iron chelate uptake ABC transporter family permease subunit [bacterium]|nr:iron chelate uptake ABC transporter family permease subunit [bacterium]